jgi:hypothetical protein
MSFLFAPHPIEHSREQLSYQSVRPHRRTPPRLRSEIAAPTHMSRDTSGGSVLARRARPRMGNLPYSCRNDWVAPRKIAVVGTDAKAPLYRGYVPTSDGDALEAL